jgi:uncharacterized protein
MLYDNAQLVRTYLHAWQLTGSPDYRRVVEETLDYVLREMTSPEGGFYSTQDADSEGEEGKFFLWRPEQVVELLGEEDGRLFNAYYDVTAQGNFHEGGVGQNILHVDHDLGTVAQSLGVTPASLGRALERGREVLGAARERRVKPGRDEKILAEWNGLMLHAFAEAGAALGRTDYLLAAIHAGDFILARMTATGDDGALRMYRSYKDGQARLAGYLEDYAAVALGMLGLYSATLELRWLKTAADLALVIARLFFDAGGGGFFQTGSEHERLVIRRKDLLDNAIPSGNSLAAELYLRLGKLLELAAYPGYATSIIEQVAAAMAEQPAAFGRLLCALDFYLNPGYEIAIVGDPAAEASRALLAKIWSRYLPNSVLAMRKPGKDDAPTLLPFLADRDQIGGAPTAYVCRNYVCSLPVTDPAALAQQLS